METRPQEPKRSDLRRTETEDAGRRRAFFLKRYASTLAIIVVYLALTGVSSWRTGFDPIQSLIDLPGGFVWLFQHFMPSASSFEHLPRILAALGSTVLDAVAASVIAAILAYILALLASRSVGFGGIVRLIIRAIATILRNIPTVAWAFILVFSFRQSEFTGFLVLFMKSFGFLIRSFIEMMDEVSNDTLDALRAPGATRLQIISHGIMPLTIAQAVSWVMYQLETNVRDATLVGMLTGTGIGFVFELYYRTFRYDTAGLVILCIVVVAMACEAISNFVRRRVMNKVLTAEGTALEVTASIGDTADGEGPKGARLTGGGKIKIGAVGGSDRLLRCTLGILVALAVITFIQMDFNGVDVLDATRGAFNNLSVIAFSPGTDGYWTMGELFSDLILTLCLAIVTTLVGALLALIIALPAACNLTNKPVSNVIKLILSLVRAVPTIVWVLIFIVAISLGAEACIVGMMFHTTAFLAKAFSEAFEEIDRDVLDALHATGASWWQVVAHCVLPEKINEVLSWTFIRFENNFGNAVVIAAMCGSGGIGYQLFLAANFYFSMHAVGLITYMCLAVSIVLEIISSRLRKRFLVNK